MVSTPGPVERFIKVNTYIHTGWSKKKFMNWSNCSEEKYLRNSKISFMESFSLYIHILSRSKSFLSYIEKKLWGFKNPEKGLFKKSHPFKKETYFFVLFLFDIKAIWLIKDLNIISNELIKWFTKWLQINSHYFRSRYI